MLPKIEISNSDTDVPIPKKAIETAAIKVLFSEDTPINTPYKSPQGKNPKISPIKNGE